MRPDRASHQIRPLSFELNWNRYAEGSVLVRAGNTHVLCTASIEESVPKWLQGKGQGWITAEYSMLPRSTHTRTKRDREKVSGRTQEIQRLIGRALRAMVDLKKLGEKSIVIDCDVLQADAGTRTTSVTGGSIALSLALNKLALPSSSIIDSVVGISVGMKNGEVLVDLNYEEDSTCDVDMNFVITGSGLLVEVQGTAEHKTFSKQQLDQLTDAAFAAAREITTKQRAVLGLL